MSDEKQAKTALSDYALGASAEAARRLELQDAQFAAISERLLDRLRLQSTDQVVELGVGAGSFSRRVLRRLGSGGKLTGIDKTEGLLDQAALRVQGISDAQVELVLGDMAALGPWLEPADVVVGRTVLHHLAFPEVLLGRLRGRLPSGARLGFIEPEFRALVARLARLESGGRTELAVFRRWAEGISRYYQACDLSPAIGATLAHTLEAAGYDEVVCEWFECPMDASGIENMLLYYDEIRERYESLGIMTGAEIEQDKRLLASLDTRSAPAVWGMYCVTCRQP
ncbi:MAG TPA: methyltransferase domain-containing protein [Pirellulales bacterium]|jgi:ubiquinone/menaquinone biosynthesis C-methylase UbiE|nr:methyltransferase domain-containing protein [Pirellulales bacterium]